MTQQEIDALKARFKAGGYPTQQDFEALIDAITTASSSSSSQSEFEPMIITLDSYTRSEIAMTDENVSQAYFPVYIGTLVAWWKEKHELTENPRIVFVYNDGWSAIDQAEEDNNTIYITINQGSGDSSEPMTALKQGGGMAMFVNRDTNGERWSVVDRGISITWTELIPKIEQYNN